MNCHLSPLYWVAFAEDDTFQAPQDWCALCRETCQALASSLAGVLDATNVLTCMLGRSYFMPFALTAVAMLSRFYALQRRILSHCLRVLREADPQAFDCTAARALELTLGVGFNAKGECEWLQRAESKRLFLARPRLEREIRALLPGEIATTATAAIAAAEGEEGGDGDCIDKSRGKQVAEAAKRGGPQVSVDVSVSMWTVHSFQFLFVFTFVSFFFF